VVDVEQQVRLARAWLTRTAEPGNAALWRYVDQYGPVEAVGRLRAGDAPAAVAAGVEVGVDAAFAAADLDEAEVDGERLVGPEDPEWPAGALRAVAAAAAAGDDALVPPLALWVTGHGRLDAVTGRAVAVVGARAATAYGNQTAADLGYRLAGAGCSVVSGSGYGIDSAALRGALVADGTATAVLPSGLARRYPASNDILLGRVAAAGLLVSLWPPGWLPTRHRFTLARRLVAALSAATVVVEAGARGSALAAAGYARMLARPVLAVPGPVTSALSAGPHQLLRDRHARLAANAEDILAALGQPDA
jgi:DNA processing protein